MQPEPSDVRVPPDTPIVLISIDTLRSDHLPSYGYRGVETPAIDALRRDSVLFEHAYTVTPLTFPAHTSLLTGLLPEAHGVRDNVGYRLSEARIKTGELPFLPHLLQGAGYTTGAAVSAYVLQGRAGLSTDFDRYDDAIEFQSNKGLGGLQRPGPETLKPALTWLGSVKDRPPFLFFHLYEPHTPYQPPEPFASRFALPYDGEIAAADAVVGGLLDELRRLGLYDRAIIVLLSDHGEGLNDHGEEEHGVLLYREAIQVPLLLKLPDQRFGGQSAAAPVSLIDVAPTIAELLDLPAAAGWQGRSLLTSLAGDAAPRALYAETFYPRLHFGWSDLAAIVTADWQLVEGPDPEMFNFRNDPEQRRNVVLEERRALAELRRELARHDRRLAPPGAVDEEARKAMAALGYLGGATVASGDAPLPDPKTRVGSLVGLKASLQFTSRKEYGRAETAIRQVLEQNPNMADAWEFLGHTLVKMERPVEALEAYRQALRVGNGSPHVAMAAASLLFDFGRWSEAEEHARVAMVAHASFAHGLLARIALERRDLETADREAQAAMGGDSSRVGPAITLAAVRHAQGRFEEALAATDEAAAAYAERTRADEQLRRGLHLWRGKILADLGRVDAAETAFRREIELFPEDPRAYASLAILYALTGRPTEVGPVLRSLVEEHTSALAYAEAVKTLRVLELPAQANGLLARGRQRYPGNPFLVAL